MKDRDALLGKDYFGHVGEEVLLRGFSAFGLLGVLDVEV